MRARLRQSVPAPVRRAARALRAPAPAAAPAPAPAADGRPPAASAPPPEPAPEETLLRALERGASLDAAVVAEARALVEAKQFHRVQSLAESLRRQPATRTAGCLASAIAAAKQGYVELALEELRSVPRTAWAQYAPEEYARAGLTLAPEEALAEIRALVAEDPADVGARSWFEILCPVFGLGEEQLARELFERFDARLREDPAAWEDGEAHRDWMRPWVAASGNSPPAPAPAGGRPVFAVMDYGHPGRSKASANIGDHIQSIAALGHLVRHQGVRLHGREDLVDLLRQLGDRVRAERRRHDVDADLEVVTVHRDASLYEAFPEGTWVLGFGWFMHPLFRMRHGFPLHRNLRPIFVSFHCNKRELLTPEAIEYLKRYGPVGCRDWTTVYLLLSIGVPAFFSGCLTTTLDTVFGDLTAAPGADAPLASVDMPPDAVPAGAVTYHHSDDAVRWRSFVANVYAALDLLETYRRRHRGVVTSRLHCYLPLRSIGVDVDFQPKNRSDIRFDGLIDITDEAFDAIRDGLDDKLERVFGAILAGTPEDDVYALWRDITAPDVAAAERRRSEESRLAPVAADVDGQLERVRSKVVLHAAAAAASAGEPVHCALVMPKGGARNASVLIASLLEHATRPLHVWVLALPGTAAAERRLVDRFPQITLGWVPLRGLGRDLRTPGGERVEPQTVARLLLGDLLGDVDRLVVLPLPAVATADVAELADLDLGGHAIAAPDRPGTRGASGFGVIHAAASRLREKTRASAALRRTAHARHRFDFDAFSGDVLVLDLERLRRDGFSRQALPLVEEYGLRDVEAMHYLLGPDRATVPERWDAVPTRTPRRGPGLVHWADRVKPWQQALTPERELWRGYAAAFTDG